MIPAQQVRELAAAVGFAEVGFARPDLLDGAPLHDWIRDGHAADMAWMAERFEDRLDPRRLLLSAQTMVVMAAGFAQSCEQGRPGPIAAYARGRDYHSVLRDRLRRLRQSLLGIRPYLETYASVDSNPVMEKVWAERAGLGFIGKNGLLIHPRLGTQLVLAVMILDEEVDAYDRPAERRCGDCVLCLEACPTQAIIRPGVVDARRCLSYQTIENEGAVPEALRSALAPTVFGCDVCQTCCPWNHGGPQRAPPDDPGFAPRALARLTTADFAALTLEEYQRVVPGSALARAGYIGLRRNALLALGARRATEHLGIVESATKPEEDPRVREAAIWARDQIRAGSG